MKTFHLRKTSTLEMDGQQLTEYYILPDHMGGSIDELSFEELKKLSDFLSDYIKKEGVRNEQEKER